MTFVAPCNGNDVSYVRRIKLASDSVWLARYLMKIKCHFSWQVQYLVKSKCYFSLQAQYIVVLE